MQCVHHVKCFTLQFAVWHTERGSLNPTVVPNQTFFQTR